MTCPDDTRPPFSPPPDGRLTGLRGGMSTWAPRGLLVSHDPERDRFEHRLRERLETCPVGGGGSSAAGVPWR